MNKLRHLYFSLILAFVCSAAPHLTRAAAESAVTDNGSVNVAAQTNGGIATASSTHSAGYPASGANNGDRKGLSWGSGGGWNDATSNSFPDWLQINFNSTYTIGEISVFTVQDNFASPVDPTPSLTFTQYGITAFQVQYWNGSTWLDVPGGNITGNNLVWRRIAFAPISTNAIRVLVSSGLNSYSRIIEVEAWASDVPPPTTVNVAAQAQGGLATASSTHSAGYPASGANNGDRKGLSWGSGGGWNDATSNSFPDWLQINFNSTYTIGEISVFTVQDNFASPVDPTPSMTFTQYGITAFQVQYWNGSTWLDVPGGNVTGNNLVWRKFTFTPITTNAIRVLVNSVLNSYARITEIEAWKVASGGLVNVAAQTNGAVSTVSSFFDSRFPASGATDGDRKGLNWGNGGGWNDATTGAFPDWIQVSFSSPQNIEEIDVFTVQDIFTAPVEPTPSMTFTQYGITAFQVQYWNGSAWLDVPGGNVTGNNLVWRKFTFAPLATTAIRVLINSALNSYSRITEIEAWAPSGGTPSSPPTIALQSVANGLSSPIGIEHARDGSGRLFIVQQGGQIKIVDRGQLLPSSFLDISSLATVGSEQGLLGLAFHPNYASNGFFYVNYTRQGDGATVISRYQRSSGDANIADPNSGFPLLTVAQPFTNHNGGQLRFGSDGYLYIGLGDGGSGNDPGNRAQDLSTLLGKMLRIDVNNASPYAIPATNPYQNDGNPNTLGEIWASGLRNPWRFSFDRLTGDLFIADVGQSGWEEVNFQAAGSGAGANYGWRVMEGAHCTGLGGGATCFDPSLALPVIEYSHASGCSITGGYRYRGSASPKLSGYFVYGDFCSGRVWGASRYPIGVWRANELITTGFNISTFGEDEAGEIYVAAYNTGAIYRITAQ